MGFGLYLVINLSKMNEIKSIQKNLIIDCFDSSTVSKNMRKIVEAKKSTCSKKVNYLKELIDKKIDFYQFLIEQHNQRIGAAEEKFLSTDINIFKKLYKILSQQTGDLGRENYASKHEQEHFVKAIGHGVEALYAINLTVASRVGKIWSFKINPETIILVEKKALEENWTIIKYIDVVKDIASVTNISPGDLKTIESIKLLEAVYKR